MSRYFEFKDKDSSKFWEITVVGKAVRVHYGKIGTAGQNIIKKLATPAEANTHAKNVIAEKIKKGYKEKKIKKSDREKKTQKDDREKKKSIKKLQKLNAAIKLRPNIKAIADAFGIDVDIKFDNPIIDWHSISKELDR